VSTDQPPENRSSPNISTPYVASSSIQPTPTSAFIPPSNFVSSTPPLEKSAPLPPVDRPSSAQRSYSPIPPKQPPFEQSYKPSTPQGHTFGVPIDEVISRENSTLPLIVAQCVIAVDEFGSRTEGIYRVSGGATTLAKLKRLFDFEPENVDFRTPAGFFEDIHAVAGILKQYLRELPEPLLTRAFYDDFLRIACISRL
jgi:hypothetical protein